MLRVKLTQTYKHTNNKVPSKSWDLHLVLDRRLGVAQSEKPACVWQILFFCNHFVLQGFPYFEIMCMDKIFISKFAHGTKSVFTEQIPHLNFTAPKLNLLFPENYTAAHYFATHWTRPHYTSPHYTAPHYIAPHFSASNCLAPHCTRPHCTGPHLTSLHFTAPH